MPDREQIGGAGLKPEACLACEHLLPDAVDGTLTAAEQTLLERHTATCADCARELEEAQRGAAWLGLLKANPPEPPSGLLQTILADTTGAAPASPAVGLVSAPLQSAPVAPPPEWAKTRPRESIFQNMLLRLADLVRVEPAHNGFHPRFAMTAAMAFFSLALSLNLAGVSLRDLHARDFTPSGLQRAVVDAGASAERRFQNLRVVYQLESRVNELRSDDSATDNRQNFGPAQETRPQPDPNQTAPANRHPGTSKPRGSSILQIPLFDRGRTSLAGGMS